STSSSAQMSCRLPVPWSMRTIGWRLASDLARLVMGTTPVRLSAAALSRPGTCTMMALPGLNPSLRFQAAGLIRTPLVLTGMAAAGRLTRSLVALVRSALVSRLSGNGNRHGLPEYGWHDDAAPARPLASADPAPAARTTRAAAVAADRSAVRAHGPKPGRAQRAANWSAIVHVLSDLPPPGHPARAAHAWAVCRLIAGAEAGTSTVGHGAAGRPSRTHWMRVTPSRRSVSSSASAVYVQ